MWPAPGCVPVLSMGHDPLGVAWSRTPMRTHAGVDTREQEPCQLREHSTPHVSWPKAPCVEPTGETERAAAAVHDALEPRAQGKGVATVASAGTRRRHRREAERGGREFGSPLYKASRGCMWESLEEAGTCKPGENFPGGDHLVEPALKGEDNVWAMSPCP